MTTGNCAPGSAASQAKTVPKPKGDMPRRIAAQIVPGGPGVVLTPNRVILHLQPPVSSIKISKIAPFYTKQAEDTSLSRAILELRQKLGAFQEAYERLTHNPTQPQHEHT